MWTFRVKEDDIKVSVEGNVVQISAEVKQEKEEKEGERVIKERTLSGRGVAQFHLGQDVDEVPPGGHRCRWGAGADAAEETAARQSKIVVRYRIGIAVAVASIQSLSEL